MFGRGLACRGVLAGRKSSVEFLEPRRTLSASAPTVVEVSVASSSWDSAFVTHLENNGLGSNGYAIPVGSAAQSYPLPWNSIDRISITFSEDVDVQATDLAVSGLVNDWYEIDHFFYDPQVMQATWTLAIPFTIEERVHLDLDADGIDPVRDLGGNVLDGDWFDELSSYPSGNGVAGGDFELRFNVISGDHYSTGLVDYYDYYSTFYAVGDAIGDPTYQALFDNDGNGVIEASDWQAVTSNMGASLPIGTPAGVLNDAPTTVGFDLTSITDRSSTTLVSLHAAFEDLEDLDTQLTYTIVSQSNGSLFDSITVDANSGNLILDPASSSTGRNNVVISATDSSGLSVRTTLPINLDHPTIPPTILPFNTSVVGQGRWEVHGSVHDDDEVHGLVVALSGLISARVVVAADGTFSYELDLDPTEGGDVFAEVTDFTGIQSGLVSTYVGA